MQSNPLQYHANKIIDYAIRAGFVSIIVVPLLFFLSMSAGLGSEPADHGQIISGVALFVVLAPAHYLAELIHAAGVSFGFVDFLLMITTVPLFWGAFAYGAAQLGRFLLRMTRQHLGRRPANR
jgi:hypothetical protein